ncbi:hypothetical protein NUSPORA_02320 [Nucleospora cyclopteri]
MKIFLITLTIIFSSERAENPSTLISNPEIPTFSKQFCITNLNIKLNKDIVKMFQQIYSKNASSLKFQLIQFDELISKIELINCSFKKVEIAKVESLKDVCKTNSSKIKRIIDMKKQGILQLFDILFDELQNVVCFSALACSASLKKYESLIEKGQNIVLTLENMTIQESIGTEIEEKSNDEHMSILMENLKISEVIEKSVQAQAKDPDVKPKIKPVKLTSEACAEETALSLATSTKQCKLKIDEFILHLIELCRPIKDENRRRKIINRIIKEKMLTIEDIEFIVEANDDEFNNFKNNKSLITIQTVVCSPNNRCHKGITLKLKRWNQIKHLFNEEIKSEIFSLDFDNTPQTTQKSHIKIISDHLQIDHESKIVKLENLKLKRFDLQKTIPDKNFDPLHPTLFNTLGKSLDQDFDNKINEIVMFDNNTILIYLLHISKIVKRVFFVTIKSICNSNNILGISLNNPHLEMVFIPSKEILIMYDKIFQVHLINIYL